MTPPRNLPNLITGARLVLAVVLLVALALLDAAHDRPGAGWAQALLARERLLLNTCLVIFVTAALSDALDGYIARRWNLQTDFGRIVDPFADKVIVCGTFVQLVPFQGSPLAAWMVIVILARELLVDGLRGFAESRGVKFPALVSGKAKMFAQSVCLTWVLFGLANLRGWEPFGLVSAVLVGLVLLITLYSGGVYVLHARRVLSGSSLGTLTPPATGAGA